MQQPDTLQDMLNRLNAIGYSPDEPAFRVSWADIASVLDEAFQDQGIDWRQITDETLCDLVDDVSEALNSGDILQWQEISRDRILEHKAVFHAFDEPDEVPLTELYENATRLGDDEGYWVDGGESADFLL